MTSDDSTPHERLSVGPDDFDVYLITIGYESFGSAGANAEVIAKLALSEHAQNASGKWLVVYQIDQLEYGPAVYNTTVDLDVGTYVENNHNLSLAVGAREPTASVIRVMEV